MKEDDSVRQRGRLLEAALISRRDGGEIVQTPFLNLAYALDDSWQPPDVTRHTLF